VRAAGRQTGAVAASSIRSLLRWGGSQVEIWHTPQLDAEVLLSRVLGRSRASLIAHEHEDVTESQEQMYRQWIRRRANGEPIAYIVGFKEWYGLQIEVSPAVLIPRPETELLLEHAILLAQRQEAKSVVDVGTGSGALAIGMALSLPHVRVVAIDLSSAALEIARHNVWENGVDGRVTLLLGDMLQPIDAEPDVILANLPYLSDGMWAEVGANVRFEPAGALCAGPTGLEMYETLLQQIADRAWHPSMALEIDSDQSGSVRSLISHFLPGMSVDVRQDYAGLDRIVIVYPSTVHE
jgi:release factor glutamine methyltransferase